MNDDDIQAAMHHQLELEQQEIEMNNALSLYQLSAEYLQTQNKLIEMELDEVTIKDTLESISGSLESKAVNVAMFIRNIESSAEQIKIAEKAMAERRKSLESKAESIKKYLFDNMNACGISKIESPYFNLTIKKNPPSVLVKNENEVPAEYFVQQPPPPPFLDKKLILEALKNGAIISGVELQQLTRLEIK